MVDLRLRVVGRPQLTTNGYAPYRDTVEEAFGPNVDYAMLVKSHSADENSPFLHEEVIRGNPDPDHISTSLVERCG